MVATGLQPVIATEADLFESIYAEAAGDAARIPWAAGRPNPALVNWLNAVASSLVRCGGRVCVVGCGLGDDARELIRRGYEVTAFDCSETAVCWSRRLDPLNADRYIAADLFDPPQRWRHRFDLVVEINTIQSLTPDRHSDAVGAIANLVSAHGHLLMIARCADHCPALDDGPPWALTESELRESASRAGLVLAAPPTVFEDDELPPVRRIRALFRRA